MARPGITLESVSVAVAALEAAGQRPTIARVRDHLGSGSSTTIQRFLTALNNNKPATVASTESPELPASVVSAIAGALMQAATAAHNAAVAETKTQLQEAREAVAILTAEGEVAASELSAAEEGLAALTARQSVTEAALVAAVADGQTLAAEVKELRALLDAAKIDGARASGRADELGKRLHAETEALAVARVEARTACEVAAELRGRMTAEKRDRVVT